MAMRARAAWLALAIALALVARPFTAHAAPSDRHARMQMLASGPLVLHHAPEHRRLAEALAAVSPGDLDRIALALGVEPPVRVDVWVLPERGPSPVEFGLPEPPHWAGGYAFVDRPEIVLRTTRETGPAGNEARTILAHELTHVMVSHALGPQRHAHLPAWFSEGVAAHLAYEWRLRQSALAAGLALSGSYIPLRQMEVRFPEDADRARLAYLESFSFLNWAIERAGPGAIPAFMHAHRGGASFDDAFREAFGGPWSELEDRWRAGFLLTHRWLPILSSSATLWVLMAGLFVVTGLVKRRRMRQVVERWEEDERAASGPHDAAPDGSATDAPDMAAWQATTPIPLFTHERTFGPAADETDPDENDDGGAGPEGDPRAGGEPRS